MKYPVWLINKTAKAKNSRKIRAIIGDQNIHTVCEEALCPNRGECFGLNRATFLILGERCTRSCRFCAVQKCSESETTRKGQAPDPDEPRKIAEIAKKLGLRHVVITSVTRDDLGDGGAAQFAETINCLRATSPAATIEVLTPDFQGDERSLKMVLEAAPDIFNHNLETVARLFPEVRLRSSYELSLKILSKAKQSGLVSLVKSGFMVGLGEENEEIKGILNDLSRNQVDIVTIGQYLPPSKHHYQVKEFITPEQFLGYKEYGEKELGLKYVFSGPLVRSSYLAEDVLAQVRKRGGLL